MARPNQRTAATQAPLDEELIARRWLKRNGYYMAKTSTLEAHLFHHFQSVARQPRGRADKAGSQQAAFSMELPSKMAGLRLMGEAPCMGNKKYTVNAAGQIEWVASKVITTYYLDSMKPLARWLSLHQRGLGVHCYGASKTVPPTGGYKEANVVVTLLPPLIMEICERSMGRFVLEVTCNLMTLNDQGIPKLPPNFPYEPSSVQHFTAETRHAIFEMSLKGVPLSPKFLEMIEDSDKALDWESAGEQDEE